MELTLWGTIAHMPAPSQTTPFPLRMAPALRERLEAHAKKNGRSVNSEIVAMVMAALEPQIDLASIPTEQLLSTVVKRLDGTLQLVVSGDAAKRAGIAPKKK
ncbi:MULTISPECIES: Arc family DNA-binding protein [Massilia]|uniref:Arc family DNA-binding protein n=1 Tax=Massilia rubra TaxID=2607910 RepID=A0ABX0LLZ9_9BURK|nr:MULTISPECIES: Arc family DNA-binding protein [Massilia]NHZ35352.1 Arc family DNA-binding protein [Massilia rubra]NHZ97465.1 Arc family DNA-binding protein [Massilia sp. CCM 8734]